MTVTCTSTAVQVVDCEHVSRGRVRVAHAASCLVGHCIWAKWPLTLDSLEPRRSGPGATRGHRWSTQRTLIENRASPGGRCTTAGLGTWTGIKASEHHQKHAHEGARGSGEPRVAYLV